MQARSRNVSPVLQRPPSARFVPLRKDLASICNDPCQALVLAVYEFEANRRGPQYLVLSAEYISREISSMYSPPEIRRARQGLVARGYLIARGSAGRSHTSAHALNVAAIQVDLDRYFGDTQKAPARSNELADDSTRQSETASDPGSHGESPGRIIRAGAMIGARVPARQDANEAFETRKPAPISTSEYGSTSEYDVISVSIQQFGTYRDGTRVVATDDLVRGIIRVAHRYNRTAYHVAQVLLEKFRSVERRPSLKPNRPGWFIVVVENEFKSASSPAGSGDRRWKGDE